MSWWRPPLFALALLGQTPARACDLALVLAVDVSGSVDAREFNLQMGGLADALRDGVISEALVRGRAEVMVLQWSGSTRQRVTIPWVRLDGFPILDELADRVASDARIWRNYSTAIGEALDFAISAFDDVRHCKRHLIDVSGDGPSNEGLDPARVQARLRQAGIVVNALAIEETEPDLTAYYFENVIFGAGAFVVTARGFSDYPAAIRRKLLREVTLQSASVGTTVR